MRVFSIPFNLTKKTKKLLIKTVLLLGIFFLIWVAALGVQIAQFAEQSSPNQADAAVVLGAAVYRDRPSPVFRERINHAIGLYQSGQVDAIIFTVGLITSLLFFFFSREHKGALGTATRLGMFFLMIGFGAGYGFTVMSRISLLIGRFQFLLENWLGFR